MKYIAFIVLGLVLLLTIGGIVLWANMPTAKLTVHVVGPAGPNAFPLTPAPDWTVWEFAITNGGTVPAIWTTELLLKDGSHVHIAESIAPFLPATGNLPPCQWTNALMPIQVEDSTNMRAALVRYVSPMNALEKRF